MLRKFILNQYEIKVLKASDYFIFLSANQKSHFINNYPKLSLKLENSMILPNVKIENYSMPIIKGSYSKIKIVYSGGFSKWQNMDLVLSVISNINSKVDDYQFTVLTFEKNFETASKLANDFSVSDNLVLKYVRPDRLNQELIKHDIDIIIRNDNIINLNASPFKIADYVSNGLAIIATDTVSNQVKEMLNSRHYFELRYERKSLKYSTEDLVSFVSNIRMSQNKIDIIRNYNSYVNQAPPAELRK